MCWCGALALAVTLGPCCTADGTEDLVYISSGAGAPGQTKLGGRIVDYTGEKLRLELPDGREQSFPAERILRIQTQHVPQHAEADALFAEEHFAPALALYRQAVRSEARAWVRREIIAQMVRCCGALGEWEEAGNLFLALLASDPSTPHFACIPLAWAPSQPSLLLEQAARDWLGREDTPAAVLLGASHLMSTAGRPAVLARLNRLAASPDRRIGQLAVAQTWRAAVATATDGEVDGWSRAIEQMPQPLRAGPYFVLGLARAQRQQWEQSALALLRVPILYPQQRLLAARSLLGAGRSLEKLSRPREATRLYREVIKDYPQTEAVAEAQGRLEKMVSDE